MANSRLLPQGVPFVDKRNMVDYRWVSVLNNLLEATTPTGNGYVVDGSETTYGTMVLFQGPYADRPAVPVTGSIYFSLDTGQILYATGGDWVELDVALTGDVSKPAGSNVVTLNTVNFAPGTWGNPAEYPVITVNEKGLVTNVTTEPIPVAPGNLPGGNPYTIQFNNGGVFGGNPNISFNPSTSALTVTNVRVNNEITFLNPVPTRTNLLPTQTGKDGYVLQTNGTDVSWASTGVTEIVFNYGDATPKTLFTLPANKVIYDVSIVLLTAFDDVAATLSVGDSVDPQGLLATTDILPSETGTYSTEPGTKYVSNTTILLTIAPGTSTAGNGIVRITYQK